MLWRCHQGPGRAPRWDRKGPCAFQSITDIKTSKFCSSVLATSLLLYKCIEKDYLWCNNGEKYLPVVSSETLLWSLKMSHEKELHFFFQLNLQIAFHKLGKRLTACHLTSHLFCICHLNWCHCGCPMFYFSSLKGSTTKDNWYFYSSSLTRTTGSRLTRTVRP